MVPGVAADCNRNAEPCPARNGLKAIILDRYHFGPAGQAGDHAGNMLVADKLLGLGDIVPVFDACVVPDGRRSTVQHQPRFFRKAHARQ